MAEILSQRKSGLIVAYETIENKLGWPESFRERESFIHIVAAGIGKDVRHSLLESGLFFGFPHRPFEVMMI